MSRPLRATYRVQLQPGWTFRDTAGIVDRLARLGISHLYLSPALEAVPGSAHGYDVVDPTRIRAELGGEEGLRALAEAAHAAGLGLVLDIVPNHVGLVSPGNPWWWDVLAHGPDSPYHRHFDIHWQPGAHGQPTLLLPELGAPLETELAGENLRLDRPPDADGWRIVYHDHAWPVRPGSLEAAGLDAHDVEATRAAVRHDAGRLAAVLDHQHYRLAHWRRANDELDHRRFFDISTLGAVRVEDPPVFADVHRTVLELVHDGTLDGLRIDHPDGLVDPVGYFHRLRAAVGEATWIVIEKILGRHEEFRPSWPVDGTVGYEFADRVLGLHLDPGTRSVFDDLHATFTSNPIDRGGLVDGAKRAALENLFGAERRRLASMLLDALASSGPDLGTADRVLTELMVVWPVYRTYVRPEDDVPDHRDLEVIDVAAARLRARRPEFAALVDRLRRLLRLEDHGGEAVRFVASFQQLTGPAVAKGLEDTVLYRDLAFVAVNEVGSSPGQLGRHVGEFHAANADVQLHRPTTMLLTSSHDTKRSEDVRARLAVLSQDPDAWVRTALELRELLHAHHGERGPTGAHEHLAFQTAIGAWPIDAERLAAYLVKAAREGKEATSWLDPDDAYEADLAAFARAIVTEPAAVEVIERFVATIREPGWLTSLSMVLCKLTSPGVPDVYQGCELWDLSLVDPDNRRPVDHALRERYLAELEAGMDAAAILARLDEGVAKLWLIRQALRLRAERTSAFGPDADYRPLWPSGTRAGHLAAYIRGSEVIALAPLQVRRLGATFARWDWGDTLVALPGGRWRDVLTGADVESGPQPVADLLRAFPVGLLAREG